MRIRVLIGLLVLGAAQLMAQSATSASELIEKANGLLGNGQAKGAQPIYEQALAIEADNETALYNVGMAYFMTGDFEKAAARWQKLKSIDTDDWRLRAKLVQTYQALGDTAKRDQERAELFDLKKKGNSPELAEAKEYCREQSTIAGKRVMVFEQFEMKGDRAIRYAFVVLGEDGKEDYHLSLGSYDLTNTIWAQSNKEQAAKGVRLFHLDGYYEGSHATYGMYVGEPSYDDTRKEVVSVLEGKLKAASSTTYSKP